MADGATTTQPCEPSTIRPFSGNSARWRSVASAARPPLGRNPGAPGGATREPSISRTGPADRRPPAGPPVRRGHSPPLPGRPGRVALKPESSPRWMKMWPRREPSSSRTTQPRPLAGVSSSKPSQLNSAPGRPSRSTGRQSTDPSTAMKPREPVRRPASSMNAGSQRSRASRSKRSISTMRHLLAMLVAAGPRSDRGTPRGVTAQALFRGSS